MKVFLIGRIGVYKNENENGNDRERKYKRFVNAIKNRNEKNLRNENVN